jgi:S-adenosylmethionine:tRNA-ribosyltransferase-isomerase (queuine synthetase)
MLFDPKCLDFELPRERALATPPTGTQDPPKLVVFRKKTGEIRCEDFNELPDIIDDEVCYANNAKTDRSCTYLRGREPIYASELNNGVGTFAVPSAGIAVQLWMLKLLNLKYLSLFTPESRDIGYTDMIEKGRSWKETYLINDDLDEPVIAFGTQAVKALESYALTGARAGESELLIVPGHVFKLVKGLLTSFHYPKSPLMALTAAMIGVSQCIEVYKYALDTKIKFVEFGDRLLVI